MIDPTNPVQFRVPGSHIGRNGGWADPDLASAATRLSQVALVGDHTSLQLPIDPRGALRLTCRDGSLGRLTLPRGIAVDGTWRTYLLDRASSRILIHDPGRRGYDPALPFVPIPHLGGRAAVEELANPRRFVEVTAIAANDRHLFVVDRDARHVLVLNLDSWSLADLWSFGPLDEEPIDVAAHRDTVYVLSPSALYVHRLGDERPRHVAGLPADATPWSRLAVDRDGTVYLLRAEAQPAPLLDVWTPGRGFAAKAIHDPSEVRDAFMVPAVTTWPAEPALFYLIPAALAQSCDRSWPSPDTAPATSPVRAPSADRGQPRVGEGFAVDEAGFRVDSARLRPPRTPLFERAGEWISQALDSTLYRCPWDLAILNLLDLAAGAIVEVSTFTSDDPGALVSTMPPESAWTHGYAVVGSPRAARSGPNAPIDFPIASQPGRYLWLRVRMESDGFSSPALGSIDLRLPRQSYTEYLPPVFLEDDSSRRFLERFLAIFQAEWDVLEARVDALAGLADPRAVPVSQIDTLGQWLGQSFEPGWSVDQRRDLLRALPRAMFEGRDTSHEFNADSKTNGDDSLPGGSRSGTPGGLRDSLFAVLAAVTHGQDTMGFPFVIEGFRERDYRLLSTTTGRSPLLAALREGASPDDPGEVEAGGSPLWGPAKVGRFRLGETSRLDENLLLPHGDTDLDVFTQHAHRFRVVLPASLVPDAATERVLRRAIEAEKPAHTAYELDLVGPRFRVGVQSTVGIDTIVGGLPGVEFEESGSLVNMAPSSPPSQRLGFDTVLPTSEQQGPPPLPGCRTSRLDPVEARSAWRLRGVAEAPPL